MTNSQIPFHLTSPIYNFAEADYLAGAHKGTTRRWIKGYSYRNPQGDRIDRPPVTPRDQQINAASFLDLLEVVVIGRFKNEGFSLGAVRDIVADCQELLNMPRPLVQLRFKTDGREVFVDQGRTLLGLGRRKRLTAWNAVLEPFLSQLDYSEGWADRWSPLGRETPILLDPEYGFGQPVIADTGIRTEIIIERVKAGDLPEEIANDFNVDSLKVMRAIQYEMTRTAA